MGLDTVRVEIVTCHHPPLAIFMGCTRSMMKTANKRNLFHHLGHHREMLANLYAIHIRLDRFKLAANFRGGIWFHVPGIKMTRRTNQKNGYAVLNFCRGFFYRTSSFQMENGGQREGSHSGRAKL